jgi:uncharacterized coiled-coil protein SlyX
MPTPEISLTLPEIGSIDWGEKINTDLETIQNAINAITTRLDADENAAGEMESDITDLESAMANATSAISTLNSQMSSAQSAISTLQGQMSTVQNDITTLNPYVLPRQHWKTFKMIDDGTTTPDVSDTNLIYIHNTNPTTITDFTNSISGQIIIVQFQDSITTITRTNFFLKDSINYTSTTGEIIAFVAWANQFHELFRSKNG